MYICALVGPSGTGKSHRATWVAKERNINYIIDDGLLIHKNQVIAGKSAKREKTRLGAVKTAVLTDDAHAHELKTALDVRRANRLLIIGTSDGMVNRICERLGYDKIDDFVYIQDIASKFEIEQALETRRTKGKHAIPVPVGEIKENFNGLQVEALSILRRKGLGEYENLGEKAVARPAYSYLGKYFVSDQVVFELAEHVLLDHPEVLSVGSFEFVDVQSGLNLSLSVTLHSDVVVEDASLLEKELSEVVRKEVDEFTSLRLGRIEMKFTSLS